MIDESSRRPDDKHQRLKELAKRRHTSLNRLIDEMTTQMLAEFDAETRYLVRAGPINLVNPQQSTILELARKAIELTNSRSEIAFRPLPSGDPTQRQPDISLANRMARVLFVVDAMKAVPVGTGAVMVLLHGFIKIDRKTPKPDLDLAKDRLKRMRGAK